MNRFAPAPTSVPLARHRMAGFTLAEAVIASGFVGIALAGILSLAPALIRGQYEIAERTRAQAAAAELLGMFERQELLEMKPIEPDANPAGGEWSGLFGGSIGQLIDALTPEAPTDGLGTANPEPITQINTTIRGFDAQVNFTTIDPITLGPDPDATTAALITVVISSGGREIVRVHTVRTDAWTQADHRRALTP